MAFLSGRVHPRVRVLQGRVASERGDYAIPPRAKGWDDPVAVGAKRAIDIVGSLALLALFSPVFIGIAIAIRVTSPGPILYPWRVVGKAGRPFVGHKFRTMVVGADAMKTQLMGSNQMRGVAFKIKDDPRVTPVGRVLRRYSLDELPQLWSVLKGDMSLVGPRPPLQSEFELFTPWQKHKLTVTPGITCLWQVRGRNDIADFDEWVRLDLEYISRWSLWLDLQVLLETVPAVIMARGAS